MPIRVLELRSVWGTGGGPDKTILIGATKTDPRRVEVTVCYLRHRDDETFGIDRLARTLGVNYVEIVERHAFDPRIWSSLRGLVRNHHFDIVHAHDYKTDLLALMLAKTEGVIPLATAHGWAESTWRARFVYYPADRKLLSKFPKVIAVSPDIHDTLLASGADERRLITILNGIDPRDFRRCPHRVADARATLGIEPGVCAIGAVGRLETLKRFDLLIEATGRVRRDHPNVQLILAGDGQARSTLGELAARMAPGAVRFLGHCAEVVTLHHALDCFVQSSDREGTSNALLEAMAMETPIVATNVGGTAAQIRDGIDGLLVPPRDVAALAAAIARTLDDRAAAIERTKHARARVDSDLSFDARMAKVERIYEELVAARDRGVARRVAV